MTAAIKPLKFELLENTGIYDAHVEISGVLKLNVRIRPTCPIEMMSKNTKSDITSFKSYEVNFTSSTNCKAFLFGENNDSNSYTRCGFKSFEKAKDFAIEEYSQRMLRLLEDILSDIYKEIVE